MKKLMIGLVAASATIFAFGALPSGTSFEAYATGEKTIEDLTAHEDNGEGTGDNRYWFYEGEKIGVAIGAITNGTPNVDSRPAQFAGNSNLQYLDLTASDATNVFYRAINSVAGKATVASLDGTEIGGGLYLDTLVKFTPGELTSLELGTGDKIALTYVEETDDEDGDGKVLSNIVVRAGYVNGSTIDPTNYIMDAIPGFSAADWHRLTVRAINVGHESAPVGFVVYIDGAEVTYDLEQEPGDSAYLTALANNSIVANYLYNTEKHALIPSAVSSEDVGFDELHAVGFKGNGCVDDISFTATPPTFIVEGTAVTIAWDANVETYTVVAGEDTLINAEAVSGAGSTNLLLDTSVATLTVTATYASGYEAGTWTVTGSGAAAISGSTFTVAPGAQLDIVSMFPLFQVGETHYGTFADALAAAVAAGTEVAPATVKLLADVSETIAFTKGFIVLDLNGRTLHAGTGAKFVVANSGASLTIVDTATGGVVEAGTTGSVRVYGDTAFTTIEAGTYDGTIVITGQDEVQPEDVLVVKGGKFYDEDYESDPSEGFYLASFVDTTTYEISGPDANFYFTVSESTPEPPAPTQILVPTAALNLVYTGTEQTGVAAGTGYTLGGTYAAINAGEYEATATPDTGYAWSDGTTHTTNISWSIAADTSATVDVALTSYIAEYSAQLEFPTATATIGGADVVGTPAWDPATITEPAAGATNTYTVTFTVTTANYAGSTGTATFKVYKEAEGGDYPSYIPTEDAEVKAAYDAWAKTYSVTPEAAAGLKDAFLLNCDPSQVETAKEDFKLTITVNADGSVTVTAPEGYNVTPTIQGKQSLSDSEEWHTKAPGDKFFRAVLDL